jgi:hypothetical protein
MPAPSRHAPDSTPDPMLYESARHENLVSTAWTDDAAF